ncbi:metallophosphoesterase [Streptomyces sp. NPDC019443]|uniref:metallophosphoesterase n=1 Tax=Streptomyces sp. NPDC019443 TaxID=3365061 RepID=UPI00378F96AF
MLVVVLLVVVVVVALLGGVHWYVWRRLVRDTTARGGVARRVGTAAAWVLPVLTVGALVSGRAGAPFWLERVLAWPGYLWLAVLLYLTLGLVVGEGVRPLLRRVLERRASGATGGNSPTPPFPETGGQAPQAPEPAAAPDAHVGAFRTAAHGDPGTVAAAPAEPADPVAAAPAAHLTDAAPAPVRAESTELTEAAGLADPAAAGFAAAPGTAVVDTHPADPAGPAPVRAEPADLVAQAPADPVVPDTHADPAGPAAAAAGTAAASDAVPDPGADVAGRGAALSRRLFVARVVGGGAAAVALGTVGYGTYGVLRGPRVKRVTVPLGKLPRAAHGFRIAVVSDIHLGPILGRAHSQRIVDTINATSPDLVAIVGDLVDGSVADLGPAAEPLAQLRARHGTFFVTGNHEYFSGAEEWIDHVRELGLRPLRNERVEIAGFDLAGVNDVAGESEGDGPDFGKALGDRDRARASVLLAHQPVVIHDAVKQGVDLQLSGHTHGGQLWPGNYLAALANPTVAGLERYGDTQLYVTRGAGAWGPPVRVGATSDITVVQLASRQA